MGFIRFKAPFIWSRRGTRKLGKDQYPIQFLQNNTEDNERGEGEKNVMFTRTPFCTLESGGRIRMAVPNIANVNTSFSWGSHEIVEVIKILTSVFLKNGMIRLYKLRVILLLEADFNFANKLYFGCRLMHISEKNGELYTEQNGGISDHTYIVLSVTRSLFYYIQHKILHASLGSYIVYNWCDCVVHSFHSLTYQ